MDRPYRVRLGHVVIWRAGRNFADATLPRVHVDRDRDHGFHFDAGVVAGGAELERRARGQAVAAFARRL